MKKHMKKTLFASFFYPPEHGGIQTYTSKLIEHLPPEKVAVLAKNHINETLYDTQQHYTIYRTAFDSVLKYVKLSNISFYGEIKSIIKKEKIEHIILAHPLPLALSCIYIKKRFKIPYSTFTHGSEVTQALLSTTAKSLLKKSLSEAENVFCTTDFMKKTLISELKILPEKIQIIPPGIEPLKNEPVQGVFRKKHSLENKKIIITVARLVERKGHSIVLDALPSVIKENKNCIYVIVGKGPEKENLKKQVEKNNLSKHVLFLEGISDTKLQELYTDADLFIMPSREIKGDIEGFGIVYLEAALHKLPVIATKTGGVSEAVIHNETGILLDPPPKEITDSYIQTVSKAILQTLKNPKNLGNAGQKRTLQEFRWSIQAKKLMYFLK